MQVGPAVYVPNYQGFNLRAGLAMYSTSVYVRCTLHLYQPAFRPVGEGRV